MNRAFYIVGIVFSVIFFFVSAYYISEARDAYLNELFSYDYSGYGYSYLYTGTSRADVSFEGALVSLFFFLAFLAIDLMGLLKVKTSTAKVMSIIGLSISGIFLLWNFGVLTSPGAMSFDEVGPAWMLYCMIVLAFSIVGLVQSVRFAKMGKSATTVSDILDS